MAVNASRAVYASYPSEKLTMGAGVAIFHLATERVVVCYHSRDHYWFLPKGRKNANEEIGRAAEREGFEESGYRNRLLPLPMKHRQPNPETGKQDFVTEVVWMQLMPLSPTTQYFLHWYVAETLPAQMEEELNAKLEDQEGSTAVRAYEPPTRFPRDTTIEMRVKMDQIDGERYGLEKTYEPVWHAGTGVDEEELCYKSHLLPIEDAIRRLGDSVMADVIRRGWNGVLRRRQLESESQS